MQLGFRQVRENLMQQSALFRLLTMDIDCDDGYREMVFAEGETIFEQGSPGDACYLILSGTATVYKADDTGRTLQAGLYKGQCFGEVALIRRTPRTGTVKAGSTLKVLVIEGESFLRLYQRLPQLREYAETLRRVYTIPQLGVMTQYDGKFMGMDCITTLHHLDSVSVLAARVVGQDIFNMSVMGVDREAAETLHFRDPATATDRQLIVAGERIVGLTSVGTWDRLGDAYRMVIDKVSFHPWQAALFRQNGTLWIEPKTVPHDDNEVICQCMAVQRGTLKQAIQQGCHTFDAVLEATGASTVCGGCRYRVQEMIGRVDWTPVTVSEIIPVTADTCSFRFTPCTGGQLQPARPGQHIMIQAQIEGRWFERPYTLTSANSETCYREITIKREDQGFFSRWLIDHCRKDTLIRISAPQGEYYLDPLEQRSIVCLVAGIGMTPALAMCRSIIREDTGQQLHIHYSASMQDRFAYADELRAAANSMPIFTLPCTPPGKQDISRRPQSNNG